MLARHLKGQLGYIKEKQLALSFPVLENSSSSNNINSSDNKNSSNSINNSNNVNNIKINSSNNSGNNITGRNNSNINISNNIKGAVISSMFGTSSIMDRIRAGRNSLNHKLVDSLLTAQVKCHLMLGWGCSSVATASDRHAADAGSSPRCGKGFFS